MFLWHGNQSAYEQLELAAKVAQFLKAWNYSQACQRRNRELNLLVCTRGENRISPARRLPLDCQGSSLILTFFQQRFIVLLRVLLEQQLLKQLNSMQFLEALLSKARKFRVMNLTNYCLTSSHIIPLEGGGCVWFQDA